MKIKSGFAKRNIAGSEIVVPVGNKAMEFNGMITLNESGGFFLGLPCGWLHKRAASEQSASGI